MQKKALGKGLGALFIEPADQESGAQNREVETGRIIPNRYQPRTQFDEEKLRELADSIKKNGILQPVIVRRFHEGQFELIAGERRWRAAQAAGLERIPVIIKEATDEEVLVLALIDDDGIVLTLFDGRNRLAHQVAQEIRQYFPNHVYRSVIPRNVTLAECPSHGRPALLYNIGSAGAQAYLQLAQETLHHAKESVG